VKSRFQSLPFKCNLQHYIEGIARTFQLYFKTYGKGTNTVLVASKVPLPNYRADLDTRRRAEHEVGMSEQTQDIVSRALHDNDAAFGGGGNNNNNNNGNGSNSSAQPKRARQAATPANKPLTRDAQLCATIAANEARRREDPRVVEMEKNRKRLPAFNQRDALLDSIARSQVLVVSGETGWGAVQAESTRPVALESAWFRSLRL
jgi:ATP-dependent RNA helicase DHX36